MTPFAVGTCMLVVFLVVLFYFNVKATGLLWALSVWGASAFLMVALSLIRYGSAA